MPVLDPAVEKVTKWEGDRSDFPKGPMYWVEKGHDGIEAIAVGSAEPGIERKEDVCFVTKSLPPVGKPTAEIANGHLAPPGSILSAAQLNSPTETDLPATNPEGAADEKKDVQQGELVPESQSLPQDFVTPPEKPEHLAELKDLSLDEKVAGVGDPHQTAAADALDTSLHIGEEAKAVS